MEPTLTFRCAQEKDIPLVLSLIHELAQYEKLDDQVVATEELLKEWMFDKKKAEVLLEEQNGELIGGALFFHNFSSFLGRAGLYLEDLYIRPMFRGRGYGRLMLQKLANIALERGCGRLEWACLDWNRPSIDFYLTMGAEPMDGWSVYRVAGDRLHGLADRLPEKYR